jgi:ribosomal protein S18 acetylase RimI-like enzyme
MVEVMDITVTETSNGWTARRGDLTVGQAAALVRPDDRCFVAFKSCEAAAYGPLIHAIAAHFHRDLYTEIGESEVEARQHLAALGFVTHRREHIYAIPTDPAATGLSGVRLPPEFEIVTADQVGEDRLRELDDELRQDVPGADGWRWDPPGFRQQTYDAPHFDPATYLVAVERASGRHAGLARVWNHPETPRLGLVGVGRAYRRRGLAKILLARAFAVLNERGRPEVTAEVDVTNTASNTLLTSLGARRTGGYIELVRAGRP